MEPGRLWRTARRLRASQIRQRFLLFGARGPSAAPAVVVRARDGIWQPGIPKTSGWLGGRRHRLLNQERELRGWNDEGIPKLWLYHLHYHDGVEAELAERWVRENPAGEGAGWAPYPISRRISNWVRWRLEGGEGFAGFEESLAWQAEWLRRRVERNLGANHLLANGKALAMAGCYLGGRAAERWRAEGLEILRAELREQVLEDGGHYELSPMYHALVLEDVLDLENLGRAYPGLAPGFEEIAGRMLGWLRNMTHADGRIAFFNDAAFGMAPEPAELEAYAGRLGVGEAKVALSESGYVRLERGSVTVLMDIGALGPDHQPAHGHCDLLSVEVSRHGLREVVNSGVSTYEAGVERLRQRQTAAHSTAVVDGEEQSEVWGSFQAGRSARVMERSSDGLHWAQGAHDGYRRLGVVHTRRVEMKEGAVVVRDRFDGHGVHKVELYWHLHPEARVQVEMDSRMARRDEEGTWHPEFGLAVRNRIIVGEWQGRCPVELETRLTW